MRDEARKLLERMKVRVDPDAPVSDLGVAQRQMVEIAKALSLNARILIMDEPTASLSGQEVERLFEIVRGLKEEEVAMIFISHHLEEVAEIGDRVTVLRDGKVVDQVPASTEPSELVRMMVGRSVEAQFPRRRPEVGEVLLEVKEPLARRRPGGYLLLLARRRGRRDGRDRRGRQDGACARDLRRGPGGLR